MVSTFTNKLDAQRWAKEQEVKIEQGTFTKTKEVEVEAPEAVTLSFLLSRWEK